MSKWAIDIQGLGKTYKIGKGRSFEALHNIDLQVEPNQVLGLIGHNGAGKSTLLKILSRITYPSRGEVNLYGKLSSLLEVGTGFHPELTGRENIFLNGSILGMSRSSIKQRFDQIVDFAGVSQFLDMPVKRYSSGMFVRLAFSVAAHLDAEILLIDEVLAVGDADFQKKCLSRMDDISKQQDRTIIFVSHNMSAINSLCHEVVLLENGHLVNRGQPQVMIDQYLQNLENLNRTIPVAERSDRHGDGRAKITNLQAFSPQSKSHLHTHQPATFAVSATIPRQGIGQVGLEVQIYNSRGNFLSTLNHKERLTDNKGSINWQCQVPDLPLMPGDFFLNVHLYLDGQRSDMVGRALYFRVLEEEFNAVDLVKHKQNSGFYLPQKWHTA